MAMVELIRALVLVALVVASVMPPHVHAAPAVVHHEISSGHAHGSHGGGAPDHDHRDAQLCCASIALQCGSAAIASEAGWSPAERLPTGILQVRDQNTGGASSWPEFEPPPPRV